MFTNKSGQGQAGRPRSFEDDAIFAATARALSKLEYGSLTLGAVAEEVGCTAPALIRRYGSKRDLISAFLHWSNTLAQERFDAVRAAHPSPIEALRARFRMPSAERPDEVADASDYANFVVFELAAWSDPALRPLMIERRRLFEREIARLMREAVEAGELVECDTGRLSRTMLTGLTGAALQSIHEPERAIESHLVHMIDDLIAPYVAADRERDA